VRPTRGDLAAGHHPHSSASWKHRVAWPARRHRRLAGDAD